MEGGILVVVMWGLLWEGVVVEKGNFVFGDLGDCCGGEGFVLD